MTAEGRQNPLEDLLKIVAQSENISNYVISDYSRIEGKGFLSEFFTAEILNKDNGETLHIALKKAPDTSAFPDLQSDKLFKNEIHFYSRVFPELDKFQKEKEVKYPFDNLPKFLAGSTDSKILFVAMENIKTAGYELSDKEKFFDNDQLNLIFKLYGKLHALSFTFKQQHPEAFESLTKSFHNITKTFVESKDIITRIEKSYASAVETIDPITEADTLTRLKKANVSEAIKSVYVYNGEHKCLNHGDCWSNNMLFKYSKSGKLEDMNLVDFQLAIVSTPVLDLSYFFYSGSTKEDMDKLDSYLDLYYESFSDFTRELGGNPEEIFPLEVLKREWKKYGLWGIVLGCRIWLSKLMDDSEIAKLLGRKDLSQEEYQELWNQCWDEACEGAEFKRRTRNICLHAVEYGIL